VTVRMCSGVNRNHDHQGTVSPDERGAGWRCGACSNDVQGDPEIYAVCNCSNCKKRTGSAFGLSAYFKEAAVVAINGEMRSYRLSSKSGRQEANSVLSAERHCFGIRSFSRAWQV
jgi:hypothetical protein